MHYDIPICFVANGKVDSINQIIDSIAFSVNLKLTVQPIM